MTRIPDAPACIKGVINLRGTIVPVVDLRLKLGIGKAEYDELTVMIVLNIGERVVGMVVDSVSDVIRLGGEQLRPAPEMGGGLSADYLVGIGTIEDRMLILVDIDRLMSGDEIEQMGDAVH